MISKWKEQDSNVRRRKESGEEMERIYIYLGFVEVDFIATSHEGRNWKDGYQETKTQKLKILERNQALHRFISFSLKSSFFLILFVRVCVWLQLCIKEQRDRLCVRGRKKWNISYLLLLEREIERVKGASKTKRATVVDGDEREDKAAGRIKLFTWVLPSLFPLSPSLPPSC